MIVYDVCHDHTKIQLYDCAITIQFLLTTLSA
eukprot:COSAG02_NODE_1003_length_15280_cov_57.673803_7_plen_32_part_00